MSRVDWSRRLAHDWTRRLVQTIHLYEELRLDASTRLVFRVRPTTRTYRIYLINEDCARRIKPRLVTTPNLLVSQNRESVGLCRGGRATQTVVDQRGFVSMFLFLQTTKFSNDKYILRDYERTNIDRPTGCCINAPFFLQMTTFPKINEFRGIMKVQSAQLHNFISMFLFLQTTT